MLNVPCLVDDPRSPREREAIVVKGNVIDDSNWHPGGTSSNRRSAPHHDDTAPALPGQRAMTPRGEPLSVQGLIITDAGRAEHRRFDLPFDPSGQVIVRVELCGICTPEQRVFRGARATYPYWGGHELCGIVEAVPSGAPLPGVGSRVALGLMPRCGHCRACRRGLDNHCAYLHPEPPGDGPPGPRGFSDRVIVAPNMLFPVGPDGPPEVAALTEPVACVSRSVAMASPVAGETALVFGAGTMGLLHTALLTRAGCRVLVVSEDQRWLDQASAAGAHATHGTGDSLDAIVRDHTEGWGCDMVFCTRGGTAAVAAAIRLSARGGRIVLYQSLASDKTLPIDINDLHYREIRLIGTIAQSSDDLRRATELLRDQPELVRSLTTEIVAAGDGENALKRALAPDVTRVLIEFRT